MKAETKNVRAETNDIEFKPVHTHYPGQNNRNKN